MHQCMDAPDGSAADSHTASASSSPRAAQTASASSIPRAAVEYQPASSTAKADAGAQLGAGPTQEPISGPAASRARIPRST